MKSLSGITIGILILAIILSLFNISFAIGLFTLSMVMLFISYKSESLRFGIFCYGICILIFEIFFTLINWILFQAGLAVFCLVISIIFGILMGFIYYLLGMVPAKKFHISVDRYGKIIGAIKLTKY